MVAPEISYKISRCEKRFNVDYRMRLFLLLSSLTLCLAQVRYDGYEVYRITPKTIQQLEALHQLAKDPQGFNFWTEPTAVGGNVDIMVAPHRRYVLSNFTRTHGLEGKLWIEDVQQRIDNEKVAAPKAAADHDWTSYQTLDDMYAWMDYLIVKYPQVMPIVGGRSYQGRLIRGVKLSYGSANKSAFIEGGIHAREWISPATVTYILNQFLTSEDGNVRKTAESRDWYIFPTVNPDGYVYTLHNDRMWRKTRKPYGAKCVGADPNRNWDYHWMEGGADDLPCGEVNAGAAPFSEIETSSLADYIHTIAHELDLYLSFHSYAQKILIPFGHEGREVPENDEELHRIAEAAAESLKERYGTEYTFGNIPEAIYVASGGSIDWVLGKHRNIRLVYCFELRDTGTHGFLLPPDQIIETGEETLDAVVRIITEADGVSSGTAVVLNLALLTFIVVSALKNVF